MEDFKFLRDRNTAFVEYFKLEDASQAMRNMNGKRLGGDQIRVDYLRSQPSRREQWPDYRDGQFPARNTGPDSHKRQQYSQSSGGRKGDSQPSNVLWVGYPPSVQIDEQMLHNAMILFGEIERIKSFPSRHYSFVEFRSVDEARRAKEGLQGRLFNDPRITIMFSSSGLAPGKDYPGPYPGVKGPRSDMLFNEHPFRPSQMDMFGHNRPMMSNNYPGALPQNGIVGPNAPMRPLGPQGRFDHLLSGPELNDLASLNNYQDGNSKNLMGPNWRQLSPPTPGVVSSPAPGIRSHMRPASSAWDVLDVNQFQRDAKRSRIDSPLSIDDPPYPLRKIDDHGLGFDSSYGLGPVIDGGASGPSMNVQGKNHLSPAGVRVSVRGLPDNDFIWRGTIAKGGTPVCHARCVPIGKGIGNELPGVVNCSARTGLDMLTKHYAEAIGFDIVFFLPDSEDDFASYTEFLRYLGAKNRAGVAKFDDGMTLFLVPPSDFLKDVLKVAGPERLYGVVLKFPQQGPSTASMHEQMQPMPPLQFIDRQQIPSSQVEYSVIPPNDDHILPMDYNRVLHEGSKLSAKPLFPPTSKSSRVQPQDYASSNSAAVSQAGVSLTPELIATLATLLPGNAQPSGPEGARVPVSSAARHSFPAFAPSKVSSPGWKQDQQISDHTGHALQQFGSQFNPHEQNLLQYQPYPSVPNSSNHSAPMALGINQIPDSSTSQPLQSANPSRPLNNFTIPSQGGGQVTGSSHLSQHYLAEAPLGTQKSAHGTDTSGLYNPPVSQQYNNSMAFSGQTYGANSQSQTFLPLAAEKVNPEYPNQVQQLQSALIGAGQSAPDGEADKNHRYQSTLQFAANLLLQLQQQQQHKQTGSQAGRGSGSQQ
ncbi:flowering time control protein FPA-like isoform X2 [Pyrus communis]